MKATMWVLFFILFMWSVMLTDSHILYQPRMPGIFYLVMVYNPFVCCWINFASILVNNFLFWKDFLSIYSFDIGNSGTLERKIKEHDFPRTWPHGNTETSFLHIF